MFGERAHQILVRTQAEADAGLFLADEDDQEGIADPAASLLARRGIGAASPDVADVIRLLIALAGYIGKHLTTRAALRHAARDLEPVDNNAQEGTA